MEELPENLQVVNVTDKFTTDDIHAIKQIVRLWHFGKIVVFLILGLGSVAAAGLTLSDSIARFISK